MSPTTKRRILLVALVTPGLAGVLAGCAGEAIHGYLWKFDATMPVCSSVTWRQMRPDQMPGLCMDMGSGRSATQRTSCALSCLVVSPYSEAEAKHIDLWGESLYAHESRHVLERKAHPQ